MPTFNPRAALRRALPALPEYAALEDTNELAARYYLAKGGATAARAYLREARDAYEEWGARAKVSQLDRELGHVLARSRRD